MSLLAILVYLIVVALIWWAITYALANLPLPEPIQRFGTVIATLVIVIIVVMMLLQLVGSGGSITLPKL
jgi:hypothetical protein